MLCECTAYQFLQSFIKVLCAFQFICELTKLFSHNGVQNDIGIGDGLRRTQHTQLKLIAGEGQGRGAITVSSIFGNSRKNVYADAHHGLLGVRIDGIINDGFHYSGQLIT